METALISLPLPSTAVCPHSHLCPLSSHNDPKSCGLTPRHMGKVDTHPSPLLQPTGPLEKREERRAASVKQAGRLPEATYPGPRWVETGRTLFHTEGTECANPGDHTERTQDSGDEAVSGGGRGLACWPVGVPLRRPPLVFFAFGFARVTQAATLKVLAPSSLNSGPHGQIPLLFYPLAQGSAPSSRQDPALERGDGKGGQPGPTCSPPHLLKTAPALP